MYMKSKDIGYLLIGGAMVYFLTQRSQAPIYRPQYQQLPPPPPRNRAAEYQAWISLVLNTYGAIADLWQPGGPFHNTGVTLNDAGANYTGGNSNQFSNVAGRSIRGRMLPRITNSRTKRHLPGRKVYL